VLQWNLRAYDGGGAQVRQLQEALLAASRSAPPGALLVVFDVPYDYRGCPTVDRYLGALVTPPLVRKRIPAYAFLAGTAETWGDGVEELGALRDLPGGRRRPLHFSRLVGDPPVLQPVFGAPEPALGVLPPELVTPEDGALVPASAATPLFGFRMPPGFDRFRILLEGPLGTQKLSVRIGINAERIADRVVWSPSHPDAERPLPDLWSGLAGGVAEGFLPLRWRVEALDADGRRVGVSASRRIVILAAP
jgi:hypothetical protein